ncbi:hypothetical protein F5J12DRAFT_786322 [Pisolithus orientalis]|uniref:uncharacterized protein n=1 Tax=Pisolithus orientalis TaxID=936130 RepID=UPI0022256431|nr:uncharacterized protein F5J12DRAFT_786322 [Pisolithus orientalis]KAI5991678.1 hypothetical protein F5J12DRAFT_786322 [Pisolithus orientalis]
MEHDTIRNLFDKLTNVVNSGMWDPSLLRSNLPLQLPMTAGKKPLMCKTPKGAILDKKRLQRLVGLPRGWREQLWVSMTALQFIWAHMEKDLPLFKLMESGWKLEHLCMKTYLAWRTKHLDNHGNLKRTTCNTIKGEALNNHNDVKSLNPGSKKCKGPTDTSLMLSNKKQKSMAALQSQDPSESPKLTAPDSSSTSMLTSASTSTSLSLGACVELPIQEPPEYPVKATSAQLTPQDVGTDLANKENNPSVDNVNILTIAKSPIVYNPMSLLAMAAGKESVYAMVVEENQPHRQKEDFCLYWDKTLTPAACENYNNEAKELVVKNTWTKSIIEQGILHTT